MVTGHESTEQTGQEETKPRTTWVWDRKQQSWIEIVEKPFHEEISETKETVAQIHKRKMQTSPDRVPVVSKGKRPKAGWKLLAGRTSRIHAADTFPLRTGATGVSLQAADISTTPEHEVARIVSEVTQKTEELANAAMGTVKAQAREALIKANEKAKAMRGLVGRETLIDEVETCLKALDTGVVSQQPVRTPDSAMVVEIEAQPERIEYKPEAFTEARTRQIIARAQEAARTEARDITARAEENAEVNAGRIVVQAQERARASAQDIIARAEENASRQVEHILAQARARAQAEAQEIIIRAEENARAQAEAIIAQAQERAQAEAANIIARAEDLGRHKLSQAEQEAQLILNSVDEKAWHYQDQAKSSARATPIAPWVPVPPAETMPPTHQSADPVPKEREIPCEGTAELVIVPPVDLRKMQKMLERMITAKQVKIVDLDGSAGKGISIKLYSRNVSRLPSILEALPEVDEVSDLQLKFSKFCPCQRLCPNRQREGGQPLRRIMVKLRRRKENLDI